MTQDIIWQRILHGTGYYMAKVISYATYYYMAQDSISTVYHIVDIVFLVLKNWGQGGGFR